MEARPKRSCEGDFPLWANSMVRASFLSLASAASDPEMAPLDVRRPTQKRPRPAQGRTVRLSSTMLLAQSGKSQGFGDRVPKSHRSTLKPDEPEVSSIKMGKSVIRDLASHFELHPSHFTLPTWPGPDKQRLPTPLQARSGQWRFGAKKSDRQGDPRKSAKKPRFLPVPAPTATPGARPPGFLAPKYRVFGRARSDRQSDRQRFVCLGRKPRFQGRQWGYRHQSAMP